MDGERGYNSSHCIGSLRVIGTLPALYPFLSVSLSPDSLLPPSYASLPHRRISFYEGLERALLCALCRCLTILYRHCGQLHRICPFSVLPLLSQRHLTYRPIDFSTFRLSIPYIPNFNQLYVFFDLLTIEAIDKFEMVALRGLLTSWRWRRIVYVLRSR